MDESGAFSNSPQGRVTHLIRILGVDVVFDGDKTFFAKVFGRNLHQVGDLRLLDISLMLLQEKNCKCKGGIEGVTYCNEHDDLQNNQPLVSGNGSFLDWVSLRVIWTVAQQSLSLKVVVTLLGKM